MTTSELKYKSILGMRSKGVTAIKIECEAQFDRPDDESSECGYCYLGVQTCGYCDSDSEQPCSDCGATGLVEGGPEPDCDSCAGLGYVICSECEGDREHECGECHGNWEGETDNWGNESVCLDFVLNRVAELTGTVRSSDSDDTVRNPFDWMKYARFYNDGSVDSEMTFTIPLTDDLKLEYIPMVIQAFRELGEQIGNGIDIDGAGMHTALLFDDDSRYPCRTGIPSRKLNNFRKSMAQLLPALYFLASSNGVSRGMQYRRPQVGIDTHRAAIDYRLGALEYRLFDTCYDNPEAILDNLVVISNTLKYLTDTYKNPNLHRICDEITFGNDSSYELSRFYHSSTHIDVLNAGLTLLKPSYYTIRQLKEQRGFKLNKRSFTSLERKWRKDAEIAWAEYADRFDWSIEYKSLQFKAARLQEFSEYSDIADIRKSKPEDKLKEIEASVQERIREWTANKEDKENYITSKLIRMQRSTRGQYTLDFANGETAEVY